MKAPHLLENAVVSARLPGGCYTYKEVATTQPSPLCVQFIAPREKSHLGEGSHTVPARFFFTVSHSVALAGVDLTM